MDCVHGGSEFVPDFANNDEMHAFEQNIRSVSRVFGGGSKTHQEKLRFLP